MTVRQRRLTDARREARATMHSHEPFPMHRCSRIVALASRHVEAMGGPPTGRGYAELVEAPLLALGCCATHTTLQMQLLTSEEAEPCSMFQHGANGKARDGGGGKASEPRKKIDHFHVFVLLLQSPTQIALKCVSHQVSTTTHLSRGTLVHAHTPGAHM